MSDDAVDDDITIYQDEELAEGRKGLNDGTTVIEQELQERPRLFGAARSPIPGSVYALQLSLWNMKERCKKQDLWISELQADIQQLQNNSIRLREKNLSLHQEIYQKHQECCSSRDDLLELKREHATATNELAHYKIKQTEMKKELSWLTDENEKLQAKLAKSTLKHKPHDDPTEADRLYNIWSRGHTTNGAAASGRNSCFAELVENLQRTTSEPALSKDHHPGAGFGVHQEAFSVQEKENKSDCGPSHLAVRDSIFAQIQQCSQRMKQIRDSLLSQQNAVTCIVRKNSSDLPSSSENLKTRQQILKISSNSTSEGMDVDQKQKLKMACEEENAVVHSVIGTDMELEMLRKWGSTPLNSGDKMLDSGNSQKDREISDVIEATTVIEKSSIYSQQKEDVNKSQGRGLQEENAVCDEENEIFPCGTLTEAVDISGRSKSSRNLESCSHFQDTTHSLYMDNIDTAGLKTGICKKNTSAEVISPCSQNDQLVPPVATGSAHRACDDDYVCPMCQAVFPNTMPQEEFVTHVVEHFSQEDKADLETMNYEVIDNV